MQYHKNLVSHSKVKGNEEVDKIAKEAADGRSNTLTDLPHILRNPLPISTSAIKQEFKTKIKNNWAEKWNTSPRRARLTQMGGEFPFTNFHKQILKLSRNQSSTILQVRSGHFPLNAYLYKIGKAESDRCNKCNQTQVIPQKETTNHFIFDCPAHHEARSDLINKIGRTNFNLPEIMSNEKYMKALVTFINRTRRLRR